MMGNKEPLQFYTLSSINKKGQFDITVHSDSFLNKILYNQKGGFPMSVRGPIGDYKYLGRGRLYK